MKIIAILLHLIILSNTFCWSDSVLSLLESQKLALENNPALMPLESEIKAHDGFIEQAGLSPNPEIEFEAENFLGTGDFRGVDGIETTLGISQTFETAGKLKNRVNLANREKNIAKGQLEITRLNILFQTTDAYLDMLFTQERLVFEKSFIEISQKTLETISASVDAGRDSPLEEIRAKVMTSSSQISMDRIQRLHDKNKLKLASQWSSISPSFDSLDGSLFPVPQILEVEHMINLLSEHPKIMKAESQISMQGSFFDLQQSNATPDFEIGAGFRYLSEGDEGAFVIGFSMPLPLRNRNQGAIRAAKERIDKSKKEKEKIEFELKSDLYQAYVEYEQWYRETSLLQNDILPNAQIASESALEGYRQGKFPYLNVLDAQRSLFELKVQLLESALNVHKTINKINYLSGNYDVQNDH